MWGGVKDSACVEVVFRDCSGLDPASGALVALHITDQPDIRFINLDNCAIRYRSDTLWTLHKKVQLAKLVARIVMTLRP